jgi:hypothetical protein
MFSNLSMNPYPMYNSMEDSKACFSNGAKGNLHWYWNLCCLMNKCFCIAWLTISGVCVCVSLCLSLRVIFPLSFIPCLNLLNNVGFDVC